MVRRKVSTVDGDTKSWIRTAADERAAKAGMVFDAERGEFAVGWMQSNLCLYEGEQAGKPLQLLPCWRDFFMRLYGWVRWSEEWGQWIRRFTHASFWGAKKNGKSPMIGAHNLYLLCGDGEQGQKVYQGAANGDQARIAQLHVVNMVKQSPELSADCKINNTTLQITHLPTNSTLGILTGDDSRGARAKEGLNGSVSYDELHVVNREMEERTSRAGISRKEPLNVGFSTAGDDPSSVGYDRFKYGRQVNSGERSDPHFLHVEYCGPDSPTEADIDEHLEEYGKQANPAWGQLIQPSEFRADWQRSKGNPREVARFKQYRLNIWVGSTNQWLDSGGWEKGKRDYTLEDMRGRECIVGMDLSRTRDMTAAVFLFPWPEEGREVATPTEDDTTASTYIEAVRVFPLFWLPENTAKERNNLFPYLTWAQDGHIRLTSGAVVDYQVVEDEVVEAVEKYDLHVRGLFYDKTYAAEMTRRIADRIEIEPLEPPKKDEKVDARRWEVAQTIMGLTELSKELERRVTVGLVQHPGNAVMSWQVGHCEVYSDKNQNIRPVKPAPHSGKSIDGIMAAVDGMQGLMIYEQTVGSTSGGGYDAW